MAEDIIQKEKPEPVQRFSFIQLRQLFQNVGIKVVKRGLFVLGGALITVSSVGDIQDAIDAVNVLGGGVVSLVTKTYTATSSFTIPSNVTLNGNGATIDFGNGAYQFLIQGANAYTTGTLAVNYASGSVTGTGTVWTAAMVGRSILIGDYWYEITARASDTAITISPVFMAPNVTGETYVIATTVNDTEISNIILQNVSGTLLKFQYVNNFIMSSLTVTDGAQGIDGDDSSSVQWLDGIIDDCVAGLTFDNVPFCTLNNYGVTNITGGTGIALNKVTNTSMGIASIQAVTGVGLKFTNCSNLGFINFSIIKCSSHGIELVSGNSSIDLISGYINSCGGDGIKLTATSDSINLSSISSLSNTGYGINIANANCDKNILVEVITASNTAGALNDLGTGTLKSATVNDLS